jgi:hypothetical protein
MITFGMCPSLSHNAKAFDLYPLAAPTVRTHSLRNLAYDMKIATLLGDCVRKQNKAAHRMAIARRRAVKANARITGHILSDMFAGLESFLDNSISRELAYRTYQDIRTT